MAGAVAPVERARHYFFVTAVMNGTGGDKRYSLVYLWQLNQFLQKQKSGGTGVAPTIVIHMLVRYDESSLKQLQLLTEQCYKIATPTSGITFRMHYVPQPSSTHRTVEVRRSAHTENDFLLRASALLVPSRYEHMLGGLRSFPLIRPTFPDWERTTWGHTCAGPLGTLLTLRVASAAENPLVTLVLTHPHMMIARDIIQLASLVPPDGRILIANVPTRQFPLPLAGHGATVLTEDELERFSRCVITASFPPRDPVKWIALDIKERYEVATAVKRADVKAAFRGCPGAEKLTTVLDRISADSADADLYVGYWNYIKDYDAAFAQKYFNLIRGLPVAPAGRERLLVLTGADDSGCRILKAAIKHNNDTHGARPPAAPPPAPAAARAGGGAGWTMAPFAKGRGKSEKPAEIEDNNLYDSHGSVICRIIIFPVLPPQLFDLLLLHSNPIVALTGEESTIQAICHFKKVVLYQCVNGTEGFGRSLVGLIDHRARLVSDLSRADRGGRGDTDGLLLSLRLLQRWYLNCNLIALTPEVLDRLKRAADIMSGVFTGCVEAGTQQVAAAAEDLIQWQPAPATRDVGVKEHLLRTHRADMLATAGTAATPESKMGGGFSGFARRRAAAPAPRCG